MNFKIDFRNSLTMSHIVLFFGYMLTMFSLVVMFIEYAILDLHDEPIKFILESIMIILVGAYFNKEGKDEV